MSGDELIYCGLRCIGQVRDYGRQYEAWAEPGRETLGLFNSYAAACRTIYERDLSRREGGG